MSNILSVVHIVLSLLLITTILLQAQGSGLGATWGGGGETYHTKRGVEKVLFYATILLIVLFATSSVLVIRL